MILIISAVFLPEQVVSAHLTLDIANSLSQNETVTVLTPYPTRPYGKRYKKHELSNNYSFNHVVLDKSYTSPKPSLFGRFLESYSLGSYTKRYIENYHESISVIYLNTWPLFAQKAVVEIAMKYNIPVVTHIQDIYPESLSYKIPIAASLLQKLFLPMDKKILKNSSKVVTISNRMRDYLIKTRNIPAKNVEVINNWQNDSTFFDQTYEKKEDNRFIFMYVGSINQSAGVDLLINAFGHADLSDSKLIIAGSGSEKTKCIRIAKEYKNIEFMEVISSKVAEVQAQSDILLLPLKKGIAKTALPSKLTAYMLSAKPIIACIDKDSEASEIIQNNNCGYVLEPENENQLRECMERVFTGSNKDLLEKGKNSLNYAEENFTRKKNLLSITTVILSIKKDTYNA